MGNRVKGKVKRKSVKAALHSGMGSKRKLSRMGKIRKKDHAGVDAAFIGRSACLKKLQISLKDFRRLCILKGVYPREPRRAPSKKKGQVYYHIKDVRAIAHEPVLEKFREFRSFMKKVRKAAGRNEKEEAKRLDALKPQYTLHHLVRERYPRFIDAVSDLDDALALTYLFAALPSEGRIQTKITRKAQQLTAAWGAYCAATSSITKSFISVKGVYFEAKIGCGEGVDGTCRWVVPHSFTQFLPKDVDYRVMITFFEIYETLLGFVLFKLYNNLGERYPVVLPKGAIVGGKGQSLLAAHLHVMSREAREKRDGDGGVSSAVSKLVEEKAASEVEVDPMAKYQRPKDTDQNVVKSISKTLTKIANEENDDGSDDEQGMDVDVATPLNAALENIALQNESHAGTHKLSDEAIKRKRLFTNLTFFLSREVPRGYLELVCLSYGGRVGWEGEDSPISIHDASITHHIVDRPKLPSSCDDLPKSREYVQPQWIVDCANFHYLLPCSKYSLGHSLPPHLSPWVNDDEEGYKPAYAEEIEKIKNGEVVEDVSDKAGAKDGAESTDDEDEEDLHARELAEEVKATKQEDSDEKSSDEKSSDEEEEEEDEEDEETEEENAKKKAKRQKTDDEEAKELAKLMMSKKAKRLYDRMQHGLDEKQSKIEVLQRKRKEIEATKEKSKDGKTPRKQKVERLKQERKEMLKEYSPAKNKKQKKNKSKKQTEK